MADIKILSSNGKEILIDAEDLEVASRYCWTVSANGYAKKYFEDWNGGVNRRRWVVYLHRLIMDAREDEIIDHISQDKLDNRRCNLRVATKSLNALNSNSVKGKVPYRGVYWNNRVGKYQTGIWINKKRIHLGYFDTPKEASKAYLKAQKEVI